MILIDLLLVFIEPLFKVIKQEISSWKITGVDWKVISIGVFIGLLPSLIFAAISWDKNERTILGVELTDYIVISVFIFFLPGIIGAIIGKQWKESRAGMLIMAVLIMVICVFSAYLSLLPQ